MDFDTNFNVYSLEHTAEPQTLGSWQRQGHMLMLPSSKLFLSSQVLGLKWDLHINQLQDPHHEYKGKVISVAINLKAP